MKIMFFIASDAYDFHDCLFLSMFYKFSTIYKITPKYKQQLSSDAKSIQKFGVNWIDISNKTGLSTAREIIIYYQPSYYILYYIII